MAQQRYWIRKLFRGNTNKTSWIRSLVSGSLFKLSDMRSNSCRDTIKALITTMRALAEDSQVSTTLEYYATDSTLRNTQGQILWATSIDSKNTKVAEVVNGLIKNKWNVNKYARDQILELATIGNFYMPTTDMYRLDSSGGRGMVSLSDNTLSESDFDLIPSYKLDPEDILHLYLKGEPQGYIWQSETGETALYPESACIHFSLGGLLGDYKLSLRNKDGEDEEYDVSFANPLMAKATQPTQTLSLLEDASILSSLARTIKFINVECGNAEDDEIGQILMDIKNVIEQTMSLHTGSGDAQSYVNPQSPNNLIYLPRVKGEDAVSVTDLNMADTSDSDNKLLDYYQNKKLSVLGIPKEALNYSSNEGLGGAGSVLSQRSSLYANALQRLKSSFIEGWKCAIDTYCIRRGFSGVAGNYELHMTDIITDQSTLQFEKRDSAVSQASAIVNLLKDLGVESADTYKTALTEILLETLPVTSADVNSWSMDLKQTEE